MTHLTRQAAQVIANLLHTRNSEVQIVARRHHLQGDALAGVEAETVQGGEFDKVLVSVGDGDMQIEKPLVGAISRIHASFVSHD